MKQSKWIAVFMASVLAAAALTGCGGGSAETVDISQQDQGQSDQSRQGQRQSPQGERGIIAKVVALNGNQLTIILAEMPERAGGGNTPPDGAGPASGDVGRPADGQPAMPANGQPADGQPAMPADIQPGKGGREIEFTGEKTAFTLSGSVTIMKGMGENALEIDLSELKADDVIRFTTNTGEDGKEIIDTIVIME